MSYAFSLALFSAGRSMPARIAMIEITIKSSIKVKVLIFVLRSRNSGQGTWKSEGTGKQWNNRMKKEKAGPGAD